MTFRDFLSEDNKSCTIESTDERHHKVYDTNNMEAMIYFYNAPTGTFDIEELAGKMVHRDKRERLFFDKKDTNKILKILDKEGYKYDFAVTKNGSKHITKEQFLKGE